MLKAQTVIIAICVAFLLAACSSEKKRKAVFNDITVDSQTSAHDEEYSFASSGDEVKVPFREDRGVKYVSVTVDSMDVEMIFDSGCSTTQISLAEAKVLYDAGRLTDDDFIGVTQVQIADGSIGENMIVNLKEVIIGGKVYCSDVQATVSQSIAAPLLLGNDVLNRVATITIDNENKVLVFNIK